jgi:hypothetical protein
MKYIVVCTKINDKTLYACPYCKWVFFGEEKVDTHMQRCAANPSSGSCATCGERYKGDNGKWYCGGGVTDDVLFGKFSITHCAKWHDGGSECYYTKRLRVGEEFKPKNYNRQYRVVKIVDE